MFTQPFIQARIKENKKVRVTGLCVGNSQVIGEFSSQSASNAMFWCFLCCLNEQAVKYAVQFMLIADSSRLCDAINNVSMQSVFDRWRTYVSMIQW